MNNRLQYIDLLKIIAAFTVVWLHIASGVVLTNPDTHNSDWWTGNFADAMVRWCVPVFVMASGALLLTPANQDIGKFYKKRVRTLFPFLIFWTLFYYAFRMYTEAPIDWGTEIKNFAKGTPYFHLWYIYMLIGLYFITPFLCTLVQASKPASLQVLIVGGFFIASAESCVSIINHNTSLTFIGKFVPYISYYLAGYYLSKYPVRINTKYLFVFIFGGGIVIAVATGFLFPRFGSTSWELMYDYLNPIVIMVSISVFILFQKLPINASPATTWILKLAPLSLGIYLIHPAWMMLLSRKGISGTWINAWIGIPTATLLCFVLSAISTWVLYKLPVIKRTVSV